MLRLNTKNLIYFFEENTSNKALNRNINENLSSVSITENSFDYNKRKLSEIFPNKINSNFLLNKSDTSVSQIIRRTTTSTIYEGKLCEKVVAIKQLAFNEESEQNKHLKEANLLARLSHEKQITHLYGYFVEGFTFNLVIEYMPKGSLFDVIWRNELVDWQECRQVWVDICKGLYAIHSAGIYHRDLKSHNILIHYGADGIHAKIADFGLAIDFYENSNTAAGTLRWVAPESLLNYTYSESSEVYNAGRVLSELINRKPPFADYHSVNESAIILNFIINDTKDFLSQDCPPEAYGMAKSCLLFDPSSRPTVKKLIEMNNEWIKNKPKI